MKTTHDGRPVFPSDSPLPEGAHGFTQCTLGAAYTTWVEPQDREKMGLDIKAAETIAKKFKKAQAIEALATLGVVAFPSQKLRHLRTLYQVKIMAKLWPMKEV